MLGGADGLRLVESIGYPQDVVSSERQTELQVRPNLQVLPQV
jgi:hypothetical protein